MGQKKPNALPSDSPESALGLDPAIWTVRVEYCKGALSNSRSTTLSVTHLPSGRRRSERFESESKAAARRKAVELALRWVSELPFP